MSQFLVYCKKTSEIFLDIFGLFVFDNFFLLAGLDAFFFFFCLFPLHIVECL